MPTQALPWGHRLVAKGANALETPHGTGGDRRHGQSRPRGRAHHRRAVAPGPFPTKMTAATLEAFGDEIAAAAPLRRIGRDDDMAGIAVFLASRASAYLIGATVPVAGGLATRASMRPSATACGPGERSQGPAHTGCGWLALLTRCDHIARRGGIAFWPPANPGLAAEWATPQNGFLRIRPSQLRGFGPAIRPDD
jgi:hypothetical protein